MPETLSHSDWSSADTSVNAMPETLHVQAGELSFCVETRGDPAGEPGIFVMGADDALAGGVAGPVCS